MELKTEAKTVYDHSIKFTSEEAQFLLEIISFIEWEEVGTKFFHDLNDHLNSIVSQTDSSFISNLWFRDSFEAKMTKLKEAAEVLGIE